MVSRESVENIIRNCRTEKQVIKALTENGINYTTPPGYDYFNIYIENGKIRIYKPYNQKCFCVQRMEKVKFEYSGIPVFMPSGKDTLL